MSRSTQTSAKFLNGPRSDSQFVAQLAREFEKAKSRQGLLRVRKPEDGVEYVGVQVNTVALNSLADELTCLRVERKHREEVSDV